jgi:flagellar hook-basal body complex protein FliE
MSNVTFGAISNAYMPSPAASADLGGQSAGESFSDILSNAVQGVNKLHDDAASKVSNVMQGGGGDLNEVMVAVEKADVSFQLMMQVRNKIVSAYQEIERMQF